jgi:hypothetical protein
MADKGALEARLPTNVLFAFCIDSRPKLFQCRLVAVVQICRVSNFPD